MKNRWLFLLFFSFLIQVKGKRLYGQTEPKQNVSISMLRNKRVADSLFDIATKHRDAQLYRESLSSLELSLKLYRLIGDGKKTGECFVYIGVANYYLSDYSKAISSFNKATETFRKVGYKKGVAVTLNNVGGIYNNLGNYLKALNYYQRAAVIFDEIGEKGSLAVTTYNIGLIYSKGGDHINAINYFNQAYGVQRNLKDQKITSQILNSIGEIYVKEKRYEKASNYLNQALQLAESEDDRQLKIESLLGLGELFYEQSKYEQALPYLNRCLTYSNEIESLEYQSQSQVAIGNILRQLGKNKEAVQKCRNGLKLADKLGTISTKKSGCDCLYQSYKALGNAPQALYYYEQANKFNDSLNLAETSNKIMGMEFQKRQLVDSLDHVKKEHITQLKHQAEVREQEKQRNIIIITLGFIVLIAAGLWNRLNYTRKSRAALKVEKDRSEALLLNILPEEIAEELKEKGHVNARDYHLVSILFTDFKSFTQTAEKMSPQSLVEEINVCFKAFDLITERYGIEKIKTIGDAYMAAGGIPHADEHSLKNIVLAGLEMQAFMCQRFIENQNMGQPAFEMRLGIHAGPIVAGIVGVKKFQYDVWGDTVNTASRMESNSQVGKVNISDTLYQLIKHEDCFRFEYRGQVHAKGKGDMAMYFVEKNSVPALVA